MANGSTRLVSLALRALPRSHFGDCVIIAALLTRSVLSEIELPPARADHLHEFQIEILEERVVQLVQVLEQFGLVIRLTFDIILPRRLPHDLCGATAHVDHARATIVWKRVDEDAELASDQHAVKSTVDTQRALQDFAHFGANAYALTQRLLESTGVDQVRPVVDEECLLIFTLRNLQGSRVRFLSPRLCCEKVAPHLQNRGHNLAHIGDDL